MIEAAAERYLRPGWFTRSDRVTHGHIDHIGMAATLAAGGSTIHLHPADTTLAAKPDTNTSDRPS